MIAYIHGYLLEKGDSTVIVDVNGIGYELYVPYDVISSCGSKGSEIELYTYLQVKEDGICLFGFKDKESLKVFKLLITVNGIGPKGAIAILSSMSTNDLMFAVISEDAKLIAKTPGIGAKTAGKLILELKDKFSMEEAFNNRLRENDIKGTPTTQEVSDIQKEAIEALSALGYSAAEAAKAVKSVVPEEGMTVESLLKQSLKHL